MATRTIPIRRAGNRVHLFLGGDRELVMMSAVVAGALIFTAMSWDATIFGVLLWLFALFSLRLMAKADPMLRSVYLRHRQYAGYYPPRATPFRVNTPSQGRRYQ
jgi:type IV secretion system protein TrbD